MSSATDRSLLSSNVYDYQEKIKLLKSVFITRELDTDIKKWLQHVWTLLPILTLIKPIDSVVTIVAGAAETAKSVDLLIKSKDFKSVSYQTFRTCLSIGTISCIFLNILLPLYYAGFV